MSERVDIANLALSMLGERPITSLDDEQQDARLVKLHYEYCRDACLEMCDWTFARKRFIPQAEEAGPIYGWDYKYPIPADILIVRRVERNYSNARKNKLHYGDPNPVPYELEQRAIYTDESTIYCLGTERVENEGLFSPLFVQALAARIAIAIAMPITQSNQKAALVAAQYTNYIKEATSRDGQQNSGKRIRNTRMQAARKR